MYGYHLISLPCFLNNCCVSNIHYLFNHIQLTEPIDPFFCRRKPKKFAGTSLINVTNVTKPIIDQSMRLTFERSLYAATAIMTTNNNVFDFQNIYGILQHGETIHICMNYKVGDITMNKEFAGQEADDFISWNATIRATNPEKLRGLLLSKPGEKGRISFGNLSGPFPVVLKKKGESIHWKNKEHFSLYAEAQQLTSPAPAPTTPPPQASGGRGVRPCPDSPRKISPARRRSQDQAGCSRDAEFAPIRLLNSISIRISRITAADFNVK